MFCNRNEEMVVEKCPPRVVETKYVAPEGYSSKSENHSH